MNEHDTETRDTRQVANDARAAYAEIHRRAACFDDMLEALRASQATLNPMSGFVRKGDKTRQRSLDGVRSKVRAAIAKAEGKA